MTTKSSQLHRDLETASSISIHENVDLRHYTSFGIGGPARWFCKVSNVAQLKQILAASNKLSISPLIIGGGTNLLINDQGYDGLVIKLDLQRVEIDTERNLVHTGAGVPTEALIEQLITRGFGGLEFAAGLPGTIGGGLAGNAGCFGHTLSERLVHATIVAPDGTHNQITSPAWFAFDYRHSKLLGHGFILAEATLKAAPANAEEIRKTADEHLALRAKKHPKKGMHTAGSYFKNLPPLEPGGRRRAAGQLLEEVGAKEMSVGDAAVFGRHANIVVNHGKATAEDVLTLTAEMARRVKERFGEELHPEVRFISFETSRNYRLKLS
jgi:UDP-N-acetylmuramate dehydrogenase